MSAAVRSLELPGVPGEAPAGPFGRARLAAPVGAASSAKPGEENRAVLFPSVLLPPEPRVWAHRTLIRRQCTAQSHNGPAISHSLLPLYLSRVCV